MNQDIVIGILGGMGTYATINVFQKYASVFPAEKEWERPRLIIDNRCTMPSRVRAFLYGDQLDILVNEMAESLSNLLRFGCNRLILACNTSHLFLSNIIERVPAVTDAIVNIVDECVEDVTNDAVNDVFLLASEGTIESFLYQDKLAAYNIKCSVPGKDEYCKLRDCIEAVKQNKFSAEVEKIFLTLISNHQNIICGCTEMPILFDVFKKNVVGLNVYDPIEAALKKIKMEYEV